MKKLIVAKNINKKLGDLNILKNIALEIKFIDSKIFVKTSFFLMFKA